ncbi:MAG: HAD family hydrolase [Nitrososphaerota archaeon]|nr:HAD family hydrolase [Nitrososphaerota archaeon]
MKQQKFVDTNVYDLIDKSDRPRRIVLIDLDRTLYDYSKIRKRSVLKVLSRLTKLGHVKKSRLYDWILSHYTDFQSLGFSNFRLLWNSPEFYIVFKVLSETSQQTFDAFSNELENNDINKKHNRTAMSAINQFLIMYDRFKANKNLKVQINVAVEEFNCLTAKMPLFKNAVNLIQRLSALNIEIFIVTEGQENVQTEKFKKLELEHYVDPCNFIVVHQKNSETYLNILRAIQASYDPKRFLKEQINLNSYQVTERKLLKVVSIGDRYDKDIAPLIHIDENNIITVRFLFGTHKNQFTTEYLRHNNLKLPNKTARSLQEIEHYLVNESTWEKIQAIDPASLEVQN